MPLVDQQQAAQHHVLTRHRDRAGIIQRIIRQVDNRDAFLRVRRRPVGTDVVVRRQTVLQFLHFLPIRFVALRVALLHLGALLIDVAHTHGVEQIAAEQAQHRHRRQHRRRRNQERQRTDALLPG